MDCQSLGSTLNIDLEKTWCIGSVGPKNQAYNAVCSRSPAINYGYSYFILLSGSARKLSRLQVCRQNLGISPVHGPGHDTDAPRSNKLLTTRHAPHLSCSVPLDRFDSLASPVLSPPDMATPKMLTPAKRVLAETTNTRQNIPSSQTPAAKKIRLNGHRPGDENRSFSSQPKSQFEEHLEKLSSDINGLKQLNAERDQKWARPTLTNFNPAADSLCFQQIDAEEGTVAGGKQTVRLFGVTEVLSLTQVIPS
jgi:hypothetical protein